MEIETIHFDIILKTKIVSKDYLRYQNNQLVKSEYTQ